MKLKILVLNFLLFYIFSISIKSNAQYAHSINEQNDIETYSKYLFDNGQYQNCFQILNPYCNSYTISKLDVNHSDFQQSETCWYYYLSAGLKLYKKSILKYVDIFLENKSVSSLYKNKIALYTSGYYFYYEDYDLALSYYKQSNTYFLTTEDIIGSKFRAGYCYLLQKNFDNAYTQFSSLKDINADYTIDANYYFALLSFAKKEYNNALNAFFKIENEPKYKNNIPYYIAEIYYFTNNLKLCIDYSNKKLALDSVQNKLELMALSAQSFFELGNYDSSIMYFEKAKSLDYDLSNEEKYSLAYSYYKKSKIDNSIKIFKELSESKDSLGQHSMYLLADCYLQQQNIQDAKTAFFFAKELNYNKKITENSFFNYLKCNYALKNYRETLVQISNFENEFPKSSYQDFIEDLKANLYIQTGKFKDGYDLMVNKTSIPNYKLLIQKLTYGAGLNYLNNNIIDSSIYFLNLSKTYPIDKKVLLYSDFWLGESYARMKDWKSSLNYTNTFISDKKQFYDIPLKLNVQAKYNLAYANFMTGNYTSAISDFKFILDNSNYSQEIGNLGLKSDCILRLADAYLVSKKNNEAQSWYAQNSGFNHKELFYSKYQLAMIEGLSNNINNKITLLKNLLTSSNDNETKANINYELGETYFITDQWQNAILSYIQCSSIKKYEAIANYKTGLCYEYLNNKSKALEWYKKVVYSFPNSQEKDLALTQIENIYITNNDIASYEAFISNLDNSGDLTIKKDQMTYRVAEVQFTNNDLKNAEKSFDKYLKEFPNGQFYNQANYYLGIINEDKKQYNSALNYFKNLTNDTNSEFYKSALEYTSDLCIEKIYDTVQALPYINKFLQIENGEKALNYYDILVNFYFTNSNMFELKNIVTQFNSTFQNTQDFEIKSKLYSAHLEFLDKNYTNAIQLYTIVENQKITDYSEIAIYYKNSSIIKTEKYTLAENNLLEAIKLSYISDYWMLKYYLLLSDVFVLEKDMFNAKATLKSIIDNTKNETIKSIAKNKLSKLN